MAQDGAAATPATLASPLLTPPAPPQEGSGRRGSRLGRLTRLYLFAFWSQFQPSEPFLVDYLLDSKGLVAGEVYSSVFCLFVYCRLPCVALVGWIAGGRGGDCRRIIIGGAVCGLMTALLTRFGERLLFQQVAQLTVAAAFASRMAVPAIAFGIAEPSEQQAALHGVKAVMLFSNFAAAALGEVLRGYVGLSLGTLFDISVFGQALALLFAVLLPKLTSCEGSSACAELTMPARKCNPGKVCMLGQTLADLQVSLARRAVLWWTAWALFMNPIHGLAMTYWQGLVRQKQITSDHNGAVLACTYFAAAAATALAGGCKSLRGSPASLVISSMVCAGALLLKVVAETEELSVYALLLLYQCLFQVTGAVATFQVGEAVTGWFAGESSNLKSAEKKAAMAMSTKKLTGLFSATAVVAGANESLILLVVNKWPSIDVRFFGLGICLEVCAGILMVAREVEAFVAWRAGGKSAGAIASQPCGAASV
mmetsp:Transcript_41442/g.119380  ORF Transcript_41442/g.119380 Transcript_41442/m.119380 type:complete len:481 (-) Transcript_41442:113-1555(-)